MSSPRTLESCAEHKLDVANKREERIQRLQRAQWLRAAILGANDGLLSVSLLMLGVGAAKEKKSSMILSGIAGALAGACSMSVGEFVSVSTQRDIERETMVSNSNSRAEFSQDHNGGEVKLQITASANGKTAVETKQSLDETNLEEPSPGKMTPGHQQFRHVLSSPARSPIIKVIAGDAAKKISPIQEEKDALEEEERALPNPYKAATASALSFLCGSLIPLLAAIPVDQGTAMIVVIVVVTTIALLLFGGVGALLGGSSVRASAVRVLIGGWLSMALTFGLLKLLDRDGKGPDSE